MPTTENSDLVESLVLAAGGDERGLAKVTHDLGIERIAPVLVDEVVFRANTGATGSPYGQPVDSTVLGTVVLRVHHGGATSSHLLHVHQHGRVSSAPGDAADAAVSLDYDLHDLLRVLFGPTRPRPNGTHTALFQPQHVGATDMPAPESVFMAMHAGATVMSGLAQHHPDLNELARRYKTDKWGGIHWFTGLYERHFREFRDTPVRLLEIGIGGYAHPSFGGESLRTWKRYFHRGLVFGVDIFDKSGVDEQRLTTVVADQGDPAALLEIDDRFGPFDIVIDDGSHVNGHVRTSFETLFPRLRSGGLYVVEDLWTSYCPGYGGDAAPPATSVSSVGMLKDLLEGLQYEEQPGGGEPDYFQRNISGMHVYHNIAFLEKGINSEGGVPAWVPRSPQYG